MENNPQQDVGQEPALIITLTVLAISNLTVVANTTIAPALPGLAVTIADVPRIESLLGLLLSLPSLAIVLTAAIIDLLAERIGRKKMLIGSIGSLCLGRCIWPDCRWHDGTTDRTHSTGYWRSGHRDSYHYADYWTGQARIKFMGKRAAVMSMRGVIFLILGGVLAEFSWRGA